MNKIVRYTGLLLFVLLMIGPMAFQPTLEASVPVRQINLVAPRSDQSLFGWLQGAMIPVIFGMKSGNFSAGNVLYAEFTTHNYYPQFVGKIVQNSSLTVDLTNLKANLTNYLNKNPMIGLEAKLVLSNLLYQIGSNSQLNINKYTLIDPLEMANVTSHFVVILYDPDKSVINALTSIRENKTLTTQPFDGDEILTTVRMDKTVENIYGSYASKNVLRYGDGQYATAFSEFGSYMNDHPYIAGQIMQGLNMENDTTLATIRQFVDANSSYNTIISSTKPVRNVNIGFEVSQLQINQLTLGKKLNGNVYLKNFNATLVDNKALGMTIFNDTNGNGIMDLTMKTLNSDKPGLNGTILPSGSSEAMYRVDFKGAQNTTFNPVAESSVNGIDELSFGFNSQNVNVVLNPGNQNLDNSLFHNTSKMNQTISNFGINFHFMPNTTAGTVNVKFDYNLGDWSNKTMLQGLSLNQMFITGITDFSGRHRIMTMNDHNNQNINTDGSASVASRFVIKAGQSPIAYTSLDSAPYYINGTVSETAYGQTLPLLFARYLFGSITTNGEVINTIGGSATSARYLYSLSYPVWGGNTLTHDPTFSIVVTSANSSSSNSGNTVTKGLPGFELVSLMVLPVIYLIKKRKQA